MHRADASARVSVRSDARICRYCGLVELAQRMVRLTDGEYEYACLGCAAAARGPAP